MGWMLSFGLLGSDEERKELIAGFSIRSSKVDGDKAVVVVSSAADEESPDAFNLVRVDGKWLLDFTDKEAPSK